tara:strand:+ start:1022 stop:1870 length:849 start_codon:yes stop_codon:yes gene_type:complete
MADKEATLSYSEDSKGWPSFYSYLPDYMIGMNGYFYSFGPTTNDDGSVSGANLYRHNVNETRNNYYGVQYDSTITGVLNIEPKTIKLFKTMSYESDDRWACTSLITDLGSGSMLATYFEQKEGEWFTFLRETEGTRDYRDRSVNGIGSAGQVFGAPTVTIITFTVNVGSIVSVGDYIYSTPLTGTPPVATGAPIYVGQVTEINAISGTFNANTLSIDPAIPEPGTGVTGVAPAQGDFIFYFKDVVAESHGARGYFMQFKLENVNTAAVELFAVGSSVMKSYP